MKLRIVKKAPQKKGGDAQEAPKPETPGPDAPKPDQPTKKKYAFRNPPEELRCRMVVTHQDGTESRCTAYTVRLEGGGRSAYCAPHDDRPETKEMLRAAGRKGGQKISEANSPEMKDLERKVGTRALLTQDDIADERRRVLFQLATGRIPAAAGNALLNGLQQASNHIEMFGGKQGVEGGAGYLRLLPGVKLVEQLDDHNRPITSEEMKIIYERQAEDIRRGRTPPKTWQECILLYLGIQREPEVAYNEKQEPIGEWRCELVKDAKTGEKTVLRMFTPYKSRELTKRRLDREAEDTQRLRGPK